MVCVAVFYNVRVSRQCLPVDKEGTTNRRRTTQWEATAKVVWPSTAGQKNWTLLVLMEDDTKIG